jgi:uncharacterized Zn finger protein
MESCPACGSTDLIALEIAEDDRDSTFECENCGHVFTGEET